MLLCSSSEKTFAKINLFCFFGPYIAIKQKRGNTESHPKPKSTFFGGNEKANHKLSKFIDFILEKMVIFTPAKTTIIEASQLYLLGIKQ